MCVCAQFISERTAGSLSFKTPLLQELLNLGVDLTKSDLHGNTPLHAQNSENSQTPSHRATCECQSYPTEVHRSDGVLNQP